MKTTGYWALKYVLWLVLALAIALLIVLPLLTSLIYSYAPNTTAGWLKYLRNVEVIQTRMMQLLTAAWVFYVGSCFASFLNVVAWRIPRGQSILGSSHCPFCKTRLTFRDNIPILGWLKNSGQCRYCQARIPKRYFDVEVVLGAIFLLITLISLVSGGVNLPLRPPNPGGGFERVLFQPQWDLIQIVVHHLLLISILFTFALIRLDNQPIPFSVFLTGLLFGVASSFVFPAVQLVRWQTPSDSVAGFQTFEFDQALTLVLGFACGAVCGWLLAWSGQRPANARSGETVRHRLSCNIYSLSLCGLFLGWQSAISISLILILLDLIGPLLGRWLGYQELNIPARILCAVIVHLVFWKLQSLLRGFWPCHSSNPVQILLSLLVIAVGIAVLTKIRESDLKSDPKISLD
jgi:prepilin signal peptidase PulO-like enzyme (type II secretory pathway)